MVSELDEIRRRVRNIWGAISSNQVIDKDVEGQAKELLDYIDELRRPSPSQRPAVDVVTEEMVEGAAKYMARDHAVSGNRSLDAVVDHVQNHWRRYAAEARAILSAALASLAPQGGEEQPWQKPGERAAQGSPADEQSGETSHGANLAKVTDAMVEAAAASLRPDLFTPLDPDDLRSDDFAWTRREDAKATALRKARSAIIAAIGAGGQAVAWRISCPDDEIYGRGPDTVRFHPLSPDEIASGYMQQPLYTHPAHSGQAVADTWFTDRALPVKAMSGDIEDNRVLRLHFRRPVTDDDRKAMCDALNLHQASLAHPQPLPLKDEVERVLGEAHEFIETSAFNVPTKDYFDAVLKDIDALLSRIRAGEQEGWRSMDSAPGDEETPVLLWINDQWAVGLTWKRRDGTIIGKTSMFGNSTAEYWRPLPTSPKEGE